MGIFGRNKKNDGANEPLNSDYNNNSGHKNKSNNSSRRRHRSKKQHQHWINTHTPSIEFVPDYIDSIRNNTISNEDPNHTSNDVNNEEAAAALRALFTLSENSSQKSNRTALVHDYHELIPVLLNYLSRSARNSSEQYLALLVLNNVSIPAENKRMIAIECNGAHILARLLCEDVTCHLMAIILVNLTFADSDLRRELVAPNSPIQLVDALCYALLVSTFDAKTMEALDQLQQQQYNSQSGMNYNYPRELLHGTLDQLQHIRSNNQQRDTNSELNDPQFLETARWCLCALKNLTRPSKDLLAAHSVMDAGIVPLLLQIVSTSPPNHRSSVRSMNEPRLWEANSLQDAALFTLLNLATVQPARQYLKENDAVHKLSLIADFVNHTRNERNEYEGEEDNRNSQDIEKLQCLKARMTLAYLVGGEGHYGQPLSLSSNRYSNNSNFAGNPLDESVLLIMSKEAEELEELLANTLHQRAKEGPGGYSAATFTVKGVLFAIRCLLTHTLNQSTVMAMTSAENSNHPSFIGVRLNALFFKALAQHAIGRVLTIDAEAAEHAAFSLYLLSSFGFHSETPFTTDYYLVPDDNGSTGNSLAERILTSYLHMENITPAGQHAADQVLLRTSYLRSVPNPVRNDKFSSHDNSKAWDYDLDSELYSSANNILMEHRMRGAKPMPEIFHRPILRRRAPKSPKNQNYDNSVGWTDRNVVTVYPNALLAVQELSFGSTKVRHMDAIDDILIANNIANSANGEKTESYNYLWMWQDRAEQMDRMDSATDGIGGGNGLKGFLSKMKNQSNKGRGQNADEPFSLFGLKCGPMCASNNNIVMDDEDTLTTLETQLSQRRQQQKQRFGKF